MEVILIEEVPSLGNPGDIVKVKSGFANNFLLPQKFGVKKSPTALKILEKQKADFQHKIDVKNKLYQDQIEKINQIDTLEIAVKASKEGKIFGAVTPILIQKHLQSDHQLEIDKKRIVIRNPIRTIDIYEIEIALNREFKTTLKLKLIPTV